MAFVKDGAFDGFKRDVEENFNALEDRVIELEKSLKKYNGGISVDEIALDEIEVEDEVVDLEVEIEEEIEEDLPEEEDEDEEDEDEEEEEEEENDEEVDSKKTK
tara:strand:- start:1099 stop:1410 length:312 start_codon:yes stop_codon:yes gene_type:complete